MPSGAFTGTELISGPKKSSTLDGAAPGPETATYTRMFVGPSCVSVRRMYYAENRVGAYKVPRLDRVAVVSGIARQLRRIDRVGLSIARPAPVKLALIDIDTFLVFGCGAGGRLVGRTRTVSQAITGVH